MEKRNVSVGLFQIVVKHFAANVQSYFIAILYGIAYRAFKVSNGEHESRHFPLHDAKFKVLLLPIIKVDDRIFRQPHFPLRINRYAYSRRNLYGQSIMGKGTVHAQHASWHNSFHIHHIVGQRFRLNIDPLADAHKRSVSRSPSQLLVFAPCASLTDCDISALPFQCIYYSCHNTLLYFRRKDTVKY